MGLRNVLGAGLIFFGGIGMVGEEIRRDSIFEEYLSRQPTLNSYSIEESNNFISSENTSKGYQISGTMAILGLGLISSNYIRRREEKGENEGEENN